MLKHRPYALLLLLLLSACGTPAGGAGTAGEQSEIIVLAAASLAGPFEEIGRGFTARYPDITVRFSFAGSQQIQRQIENGSPGNVFASADPDRISALVTAGLIAPGTALTFAENQLTVAAPASEPGRVASLRDLAKPGVRIDLAGPEVPAGRYTLELLRRAERSPEYGPAFRQAVLNNVVSYEDNVRAVVTKVSLGEADAGIVYESDVAAQGVRLRRIAIPDQFNVRARYAAAPLKGSRGSAAAGLFVRYLASPEAQAVLGRHGLLPAPAASPAPTAATR